VKVHEHGRSPVDSTCRTARHEEQAPTEHDLTCVPTGAVFARVPSAHEQDLPPRATSLSDASTYERDLVTYGQAYFRFCYE